MTGTQQKHSCKPVRLQLSLSSLLSDVAVPFASAGYPRDFLQMLDGFKYEHDLCA
jgi:hypothetical protein